MKKQFLNWTNLKENLCPKCKSSLKRETKDFRVCSNSLCDFKIREEKLKSIASNDKKIIIKEVD